MALFEEPSYDFIRKLKNSFELNELGKKIEIVNNLSRTLISLSMLQEKNLKKNENEIVSSTRKELIASLDIAKKGIHYDFKNCFFDDINK